MTFDKDENGRLISTGMIQLVDDGYIPDVGLQKVSTYETYSKRHYKNPNHEEN